MEGNERGEQSERQEREELNVRDEERQETPY